jgi:sterol desaturase/sphingolipid hydroxylase (fatty acid hydroxylase superfamily)
MTLAILGGTMAALALLERVERLRFRPSPFFRPLFGSDVIYLLTGYVAGSSLAIAYVVGATNVLGALGVPRPASGLPLWLATPLALVLLDLGNYVAHWLLHRVDVLWEFHKAHHSSPTLDWLAAFRSHLVEQVLRRLLAPLPLIAAGCAPDAVVLAAALFYAWASLNHANLRLPLGFLEPVLVTPRLHRLHHLPRTTERNLGALLTLWDRLRGTLVVTEPAGPERFGIPGELDSYPLGWLRQLVAPVLAMAGGRREPWRREYTSVNSAPRKRIWAE